MGAALSFTLSLFMCFILIPLCKRYSAPLGLVDIPSDRKVHSRTIPRSGGLAISLAVLLPLVYFFGDIDELLSLVLGSIIIVVFGLIDDKYEISYSWKFLGQVIAILVFMAGAPEFNKYPFGIAEIPKWLSLAIIFLFILGTTNAVNLSDGLDGLAAGTILLGLGFIAYLAFEAQINSVFMVACGLIGALLGFLRYNTHPASIFMGDTGSQFIGYMSATLVIIITQSEASASNPLLPCLILGLPLLDTAMVMGIRIYQKKSPFTADKNHIHHQLIKLGFHHYETVAILYFLQIVLVLLAYFFRHSTDAYIIVLLCIFSSVTLGLILIARQSNWQFHLPTALQTRLKQPNFFLCKFSWICHHGSLLVTLALGATWLALSASINTLDPLFTTLSKILLGLLIVGLLIFTKLNKLLVRIGAYSVSVLTLYSYSILGNSNLPTLAINSIFIILLFLLTISVFMTREKKFRLNNQDILIFFILSTMPLLPKEVIGEASFGTMLLQLAILLYSIEFLITKNSKNTKLLNIFIFLTLAILSANLSVFTIY